MRKKLEFPRSHLKKSPQYSLYLIDNTHFSYYNKSTVYEFDGFEWDLDKQDKVFIKHGFDIAVDAPEVFDDPIAITRLSPQKGEERYKTTGLWHGKLYTIIHTPRNGKCRIITMRRAHTDEEEAYEDDRKI